MSTEAYKELLKRYLDGKCTEEEKVLVEEWYATLNSTQKLTDTAYIQLENKIWEKVAEQTQEQKPQSRIWLKIAAAVLIFTLGFWYANNNKLTPVIYMLSSNHVKTENKSNHIQNIALSDGTQVTLYPNSTLYYSSQFTGNTREVYLDGKAFFDVASNKQKPFYVKNHHNTIHVLGTSFMVESFKKLDKNSIEVFTGKVWVKENLDEKELILTPNMKVSYNTVTKNFEEGIVQSPKLLDQQKDAITDHSFKFNEAPLTQIIGSLEDTYGLHIEMENPQLEKCTFTGNLEDENLFKKLELLCTTLGAKYEVKNTTIYIKGSGCNQ